MNDRRAPVVADLLAEIASMKAERERLSGQFATVRGHLDQMFRALESAMVLQERHLSALHAAIELQSPEPPEIPLFEPLPSHVKNS